jgi:hypothetical protein
MTELLFALILGLTSPTPPKIAPTTPQNASQQVFDPIWDIWGDQKENAQSVAYCESRFDANAENGRYIGLFQISYTLWGKYYGLTKEQLKDPVINSQTARKIWSRSDNWDMWSCKP